MSLLRKLVAKGIISVSEFYLKKVEEQTRHIADMTSERLNFILTQNKNTDYGRKYGFASIKTKEDYRKAVPLITYADVKDEIDRIMTGDENVLTAEPVKAIFLSAGTTSKQKLVPVTQRGLNLYAKMHLLMAQGLLARHIPATKNYGRGLHLNDMIVNSITPKGLTVSAAPAVGMRKMKDAYPFMWTTPIEVLSLKAPAEVSYVHLLFGLKERNLEFIGAAYASSMLDLFKKLENNWGRFVDNIARAEISHNINIPEQVRIKIQKKMKPDPVRARELAQEFEKGFDDIARRIWPNFCYVQTVAGAGFAIYAKKLRRYTGNIPLYSSTYGACEGLIGVSMKMEWPYYAVMPFAGYHEFIPIEEVDKENPITLGAEQLMAGEQYETVMTNYNGLYRYRMGDVVRVVGHYNQAPELEFLYRQGNLMNICAEKTSEDAACHALLKTFSHMNLEMNDWTAMPSSEGVPGHYIFFVELTNQVAEHNLLRSNLILDEELGKANSFYRHWQMAGKLGYVQLCIVEPGTFTAFREKLLVRGTPGSTMKTPRVLKSDDLITFMKNKTKILLQKRAEAAQIREDMTV